MFLDGSIFQKRGFGAGVGTPTADDESRLSSVVADGALTSGYMRTWAQSLTSQQCFLHIGFKAVHEVTRFYSLSLVSI